MTLSRSAQHCKEEGSSFFGRVNPLVWLLRRTNHEYKTARPRRESSLSIAYLPIDQLKGDPENARQHSAKQIRQIAQSIESFGFNVPLLIDRDLNVIAGHGRLLACKRLGWSEVPTIRLEHLSEAQK